MTYFIEVTEYQTYANAEADFHFSYNANSGGGNRFWVVCFPMIRGNSHHRQY